MANSNKKIVDAFLGVASKATESWQNNLNELISKGKISREEGLNLLQSVEEKMKKEQEKYLNFTQNMFTSFKNSLTNDAEEPIKSPEVQQLEERVRVLELKMGLMARELMTLKTNTKKTAPRTRKSKK